jgi:phage gp36-like protein
MKASVTAAVPTVTQIRTEMDTNSTQLAAILSAILATNNLSSLANIYGPGVMEVPSSGSRVFKFTLAIKDAEGKAVNLDSLPTITVTNESGTSRAAGLSSVTAAATGKYTFTYTQTSSAASEQLTFESSGTVSGEARPAYWVAVVADYDATSMLTAIDAALALVKAKTDNLPASPAAVGSAMTLTSAYDAAKTAASQTSVTAIQTDVTTLLGRITANLFSGITYLKNWLGTLAGKTADATTLAEINATTAGAGYSNTTDSLEAIRDNTGSGGITAGDIEDIVDGVSASLTAPGFAASIAIQEGTYATVADVEARLTAYGVTLAADVEEYDGTRGSDELQMIEVAIEYSNSLIDEYIVDLVHPTSRASSTFTRPSGNAWLRDRCVDIACYRLATLGGRTASDVLAGDYASAVDRLAKAREQMIRIPNLIYTSPTRPYATEYGGGIGIVRRAGT